MNKEETIKSTETIVPAITSEESKKEVKEEVKKEEITPTKEIKTEKEPVKEVKEPKPEVKKEVKKETKSTKKEEKKNVKEAKVLPEKKKRGRPQNSKNTATKTSKIVKTTKSIKKTPIKKEVKVEEKVNDDTILNALVLYAFKGYFTNIIKTDKSESNKLILNILNSRDGSKEQDIAIIKILKQTQYSNVIKYLLKEKLDTTKMNKVELDFIEAITK